MKDGKKIVPPTLTKKQAIAKLWEMSDLSYLLKGVQKDMRNKVYESIRKVTIFLASRRLGKSFTMCLIAIEFCLKKDRSTVKLLFPKKKDAKAVSREHFRTILRDCPAHLMPEWKEADKEWIFPNGSMIQMAGTDGGSAESVRGSAADLVIIDESGFCDYNEFEYIVQSILMPTLLTTKGKMIMASTPSKEIDHPFMTKYVLPAKQNDTIVEYDIYSNPMITSDMIDEIAEEYPGGKDDPNFQREFLLKTELTMEDIVIPESFNKDLMSDVIKESDKPAYYDAYVSGDPAVIDLTGILYAYWDFNRAKLVILDESVLGGEGMSELTTQEIADAITRKERIHFTNPWTNERIKPYKRVMDNNYKILINDLFHEHGLQFFATAKDNKDAQINVVRMMIKRGDIEIHPRCKNLLYHIKTARWDRARKKFLRSKGDSTNGIKANHADLVDALIYLVRNLDKYKNPYPAGYGEASGPNTFDPNPKKKNKYEEIAEQMFNMKPKKNRDDNKMMKHLNFKKKT